MYIEVTQDSVGIIESSNESIQGIYTGGIQCCLIMVFKCTSATVLVHDSGQLEIAILARLLSEYGEVKDVTVAFGPELNSEHFNKRLQLILSKVNFVGGIGQVHTNLSTFAFLYTIDGNSECISDHYPDTVMAIPKKALRMSCIELNNFFLEPRSQKLQPSIQYRNGAYQSEFGLDYTLSEMLNILKEQPDFFFANLAFLEKAHRLDLVSLPSTLLGIEQNNNVSRFMFNVIDNASKQQENLEYQKYFKIA
jgi:hypothetical protein